jgi:hypothetical protein
MQPLIMIRQVHCLEEVSAGASLPLDPSFKPLCDLNEADLIPSEPMGGDYQDNPDPSFDRINNSHVPVSDSHLQRCHLGLKLFCGPSII